MAVKVNGNAGTMKDVMNYFGYTSAGTFSGAWKALSEDDKVQLKNATGKGVTKDGTPPADAPLDY